MKIIVLRTILFLLLSTILLVSQSNSYSTDIQSRIRRVENGLMGWVQTPDSSLHWSIEERMKYHKIHGVSIAVIHNYKMEWAKGYGLADATEKRKVTPQTLFQAASISKSLNAVGVLKLVQDKKIDLDTDINQYLRSWKFPYDSLSKNKKITVKNLLNHTGGLTVSGFPGYFKTDSIPTLIQILDGKRPSKTPAVRSEFEPGLKYQYSGGGTCISQMIITDVSHQNYGEYMFQHVLKPLRMDQSFYLQPPPLDKQEVLATGYRRNGSEVKGKYCIYPEIAAGGLWTNPTDLTKYIIETQLAYKGKSSKVLSPELTRLRLKPFKEYSALGVFIENIGSGKYFEHSGGNSGFTCDFWGDFENGNGVVVMLNSDNVTIMKEIINSVAYVYGWKDFYKPVIKNIISIPDTILSSYVGDYLFGDTKLTIVQKNKKLYIVEDWPWEIFFTSDTEFFVTEVEGDFKFQRDKKSKVTGIMDLKRGKTANKIN